MNANALRIVALLVALAGLAVLLAGPSLGESAAQGIIARHGGSMDTAQWMAQTQTAVTSYQIIGAVLLAVGLLRGLAR